MNTTTVNELTEIGFSPVSAVLIVALLALVGAVVWLHQKQSSDRETWHTETRARVAELKEQVDALTKEREGLLREQTLLKEKVERFLRCPRKDCPMRLP